MALSNTTNTQSISGNGNESYSFTVPFFDVTDIKCFEQLTTTSTPTELTKSSGSAFSDLSSGEFTFTFTDKTQGGTVFIKTSQGAALATGQTATIERVVPLTQNFDLKEGAAIDPTALNTALDRVVAQNQQQQDDITKAITFPATDGSGVTYSVDEAAASRSGKVLGFNSAGSIITVEPQSLGTDGTIAAGQGLSNVGGTFSVDNDSSHLDFDGSGKLKIATDGVTSTELADNAVDTASITDLNVTTGKLANDAVDFTKMAHIAANSVIGNATSGTDTPAALTVQSALSSTSGNLAYASAIKTYVDNLIPKFYIINGCTGGITVSSTSHGLSAAAVSAGNSVTNTFTISSNEEVATASPETVTYTLNNLTSNHVTIPSAKISGMYLRVVSELTGGDQGSDYPFATLKYRFPLGDGSTSVEANTIHQHKEGVENQVSTTGHSFFIPVNAANGSQSTVVFEFSGKKNGSNNTKIIFHIIGVTCNGT